MVVILLHSETLPAQVSQHEYTFRIYILLQIKKNLLHTLFCLFLKLSKTFSIRNLCFGTFCVKTSNLISRSHIDPSHFRKINWLPVSDRVEYCIGNTIFNYWNGIVPGYIHEMFKPSLCRYSTRSQMALDIPLQKTIKGQKSLSFLRPKIWSNIGPSIKNVRTWSSFMHAIKKNILLHLQN